MNKIFLLLVLVTFSLNFAWAGPGQNTDSQLPSGAGREYLKHKLEGLKADKKFMSPVSITFCNQAPQSIPWLFLANNADLNIKSLIYDASR